MLSGIGVEGKTMIEPSISFKGGLISHNPILNVSIEEADARIMIHIKNAVQSGMKRIVVISNDTDVLVLCLHFWMDFCEVR